MRNGTFQSTHFSTGRPILILDPGPRDPRIGSHIMKKGKMIFVLHLPNIISISEDVIRIEGQIIRQISKKPSLSNAGFTHFSP